MQVFMFTTAKTLGECLQLTAPLETTVADVVSNTISPLVYLLYKMECVTYCFNYVVLCYAV